jgi:hypothetical protein
LEEDEDEEEEEEPTGFAFPRLQRPMETARIRVR